jgi:hypothetical protein
LRYEAGAFVMELELLLNNLSSDESAKFERDRIINNSYSSSGNHIFLNEDVIIEDDINPNNFNYKKVTDFYVDKYLRNFDIFYKKQPEKSIRFSDIYVSEVKQGDYIYLEVFYQSKFDGSHLTYKERYQQTSRIATIIANRKEKGWELRIASIVFYNPKKHSQLFNLRSTIDNKTETVEEEVEEKPEQVTTNQKSKKNKTAINDWLITASGSLTFDSNINKPGLGASFQIQPIDNRYGASLSIRYIFRENFSIGDTLFTVNRTAIGALLHYSITNNSTGFLPYISFGLDYLSSTLKQNDFVPSKAGANALGLVLGGGMKFYRKPDDRLFYRSSISLISGKVQRMYLEVGLGFVLN